MIVGGTDSGRRWGGTLGPFRRGALAYLSLGQPPAPVTLPRTRTGYAYCTQYVPIMILCLLWIILCVPYDNYLLMEAHPRLLSVSRTLCTCSRCKQRPPRRQHLQGRQRRQQAERLRHPVPPCHHRYPRPHRRLLAWLELLLLRFLPLLRLRSNRRQQLRSRRQRLPGRRRWPWRRQLHQRWDPVEGLEARVSSTCRRSLGRREERDSTLRPCLTIGRLRRKRRIFP